MARTVIQIAADPKRTLYAFVMTARFFGGSTTFGSRWRRSLKTIRERWRKPKHGFIQIADEPGG